MREKDLEQKLVKAIRQAGGMCPKFVPPGLAGMPDRLVLLPGSRMAFVEVKAPGEKPRPLQRRRHEQLRSLGFLVYVLDDPDQISRLLESIDSFDCHSERVILNEAKNPSEVKSNDSAQNHVQLR